MTLLDTLRSVPIDIQTKVQIFFAEPMIEREMVAKSALAASCVAHLAQRKSATLPKSGKQKALLALPIGTFQLTRKRMEEHGEHGRTGDSQTHNAP